MTKFSGSAKKDVYCAMKASTAGLGRKRYLIKQAYAVVTFRPILSRCGLIVG